MKQFVLVGFSRWCWSARFRGSRRRPLQ